MASTTTTRSDGADNTPAADRRHRTSGRAPTVGLRQWPIGGSDALRFLGAYLVVAAIGVGLGELITHPLHGSAIQRWDTSIEEWLADHRTGWLNSATFIGSQLADSVVKISVTALVAIVMLAVWRRWLEPLMVAVTLVFEAAAFITITWIVGRPRPAVERLETSPVGSSFPSGHVAAAVAYFGIVVVIFWHTRRRLWRVLSVTVVTLITLGAAFSRMYRGMHHLTDVLAGMALGLASVLIVRALLVRAARRRGAIPPGLTISDEPAAVDAHASSA